MLLEAHPDAAVVIVDLHADHCRVLRCQRPPMRTLDDLVAVLLDGDRATSRAGRDPVAPAA